MVTGRLHDPCGGDLSLDFTNSVDLTTTGESENERLTDYAALLRWSREAGSLGEEEAEGLARLARDRPAAARRVLLRARHLREALFALLLADVEGRPAPEEELALFHQELARALARRRAEPAGAGYAWRWEGTASSLESPLWPIVHAAAELLTSPERELVKMCAADNCLWLFVDRTKNHRRRWCDMRVCGNREKVRQHRRRKRG